MGLNRPPGANCDMYIYVYIRSCIPLNVSNLHSQVTSGITSACPFLASNRIKYASAHMLSNTITFKFKYTRATQTHCTTEHISFRMA